MIAHESVSSDRSCGSARMHYLAAYHKTAQSSGGQCHYTIRDRYTDEVCHNGSFDFFVGKLRTPFVTIDVLPEARSQGVKGIWRDGLDLGDGRRSMVIKADRYQARILVTVASSSRKPSSGGGCAEANPLEKTKRSIYGGASTKPPGPSAPRFPSIQQPLD